MATEAEEQVASWLGGRSFASWRDEFDRRGYLIFERVLPQDGVAEIRAALAPLLARDLKGRNDFEGVKTNRVYALLAKSLPPEIAGKLPERVRELIGYSIHPPFMGHVDGLHPKRLLQTMQEPDQCSPRPAVDVARR